MTRTKSTAQVMHEAAEEEAESRTGGDDDGHGGLTPIQEGGMAKVLTVWDVIAYGIGSTLGAGIYAITGSGAAAAGPAIVVSFLVAATACLFSAFSYMEFAARVPIAGSAYTFTYVCLGELAAWFVGWNLTLEYAISAAVVARTWSSNLELFINQIGGNYPSWLSSISVEWGITHDLSIMSAVICLVCMCILLLGVKESSNFNIFITFLNISVILFIIILGSFHVNSTNWTIPEPGSGKQPSYFPMGMNGVLTGAATAFFSYIGFDAVTTLSEEVKNPKRDVPIGIIATLVISTLLYVGTAIVVTGMQPWYEMAPNGSNQAPLATAFNYVGVKWAATLISGATVIAVTGSTLTSLFGQPRIFYRMAKDGLLFAPFGRLHPTTKAPLWGTIYTGFGAGIIAFLIPVETLANMISIGTLLAFSTVCAGVVILRFDRTTVSLDGSHLMSSVVAHNPSEHLLGNEIAGAAQASYHTTAGPGAHGSSSADSDHVESLRSRLFGSATFWLAIFLLPCVGFCASLRHSDTCPIWIMVLVGVSCFPPVIIIARMPICVYNLPKEGNFICPLVPYLPCLGIFTNCYLITSLDIFSYIRVIVWTAIGMSIYFGYGIFHSTLLASIARYDASQANLAVGGGNAAPFLVSSPVTAEYVEQQKANGYSAVPLRNQSSK